MEATVKHLFWQHGINLTDKQEQDILELNNSFAAAGSPGFADWLAQSIGINSTCAIDLAQLALSASIIAEMDSAEAFEQITASLLTTLSKFGTITAT